MICHAADIPTEIAVEKGKFAAFALTTRCFGGTRWTVGSLDILTRWGQGVDTPSRVNRTEQ